MVNPDAEPTPEDAPKADARVNPEAPAESDPGDPTEPPVSTAKPVEIGGPKGPEPTRYGDWEHNGRCSDF